MTKKEFKKRWESNDNGGGITVEDCADCYVKWNLGTQPKCKPILEVVALVIKAAGVKEN